MGLIVKLVNKYCIGFNSIQTWYYYKETNYTNVSGIIIMENIILDSIDAEIYMIDPKTHSLIYVNRKMAERLGLPVTDTLQGVSGPDGSLPGTDAPQGVPGPDGLSGPVESNISCAGTRRVPTGLTGVKCWDLVYDDQGEQCPFCPLRHMGAVPELPYHWESYNKKNGRYYQNVSRMIDLPDGRKAQLTHSTDVTGIKELLLSLENKRNDYLSRMSHEILTPMNAIIGMSKIASATNDVAKIKNCLLRVDDASKQLLAIINNLIDISRLEADKLELVISNVHLENLLIEVCAEVMARANEKAQEFQVVIDRDVPTVFRTDGQRLSQVITHLLLNAVKFTPVGGKISLRASLSEDAAECGPATGGDDSGTCICFSISDTGIGITEQDMGRLFAAFEQADGSMTRTHSGVGLGLAIARRLVLLLGGDISVESEPNAGSAFTFNIKAGAADNAGGHTSIHNLAGVSLNILYADGNKEARDFFGMLMREYGVRYKCVEDGFAAIDSIERAISEQKPFTILFADLRMPHMNGIDTVRQIRQKFEEPPVVVLMAGVEWNMIEQAAEEAGIHYFITKPLFPSTIIDNINQIVGPPKQYAEGADNYGAGGLGLLRSAAGTGAVPDFSSRRILLVDDVAANNEIIAAYLEPTGAQLDYARGGIEAIGLYCESPHKYDMILMDLHMPEMDGFETAINIRLLEDGGEGRVTILALTAEVFEKDIARCRQSGMDGHIRKPVSEGRLYKKLSEYLLAGTTRDGSVAIGADSAAAEAGILAGSIVYASDNTQDTITYRENTPINANSWQSPGGFDDYSKYLPVFDVAEAMKNLRYIRRLYLTMLASLKTSPIFDDVKKAMKKWDFNAIGESAQACKRVAQKLCLPELIGVIDQIEAISRHKIKQPEVIDAFIAASGNIFSRLDDLIETFDREANT